MQSSLFSFVLCLPLAACAGTIEPPRDAAGDVVPVVARQKINDDFWLEQEAAARRAQPLPRPRSISLGIVGQGKLAGGFGADELAPSRSVRGPNEPRSWQEYVTAPSWVPSTTSNRVVPYNPGGYPAYPTRRRGYPRGAPGYPPDM